MDSKILQQGCPNPWDTPRDVPKPWDTPRGFPRICASLMRKLLNFRPFFFLFCHTHNSCTVRTRVALVCVRRAACACGVCMRVRHSCAACVCACSVRVCEIYAKAFYCPLGAFFLSRNAQNHGKPLGVSHGFGTSLGVSHGFGHPSPWIWDTPLSYNRILLSMI